MSNPTMRFVVVNNMAPRAPSLCAACSRPLERGYLRDFSTSRHYCGIECSHRRMVVNGYFGSAVLTTPFDLAIAWPRLTVDVASALFDSAWGNNRV
jgi:hypothetical protein